MRVATFYDLPGILDIGADEVFYAFAFIEGAALAIGTVYLLWDRAPHHAIAVALGILAIWGYLCAVPRQTTVYWTLVPRMVMWALAGAWGSTFLCPIFDAKSGILWQIPSACLSAALILSNALLAKPELPRGSERSTSDDSAADEVFRVLVGLESLGLAVGVGYALWNKMAVLPYNAVPSLAGVVFGATHFLATRKHQAIYWMLLPRMLMWGAACAWTLKYGSSALETPVDLGWQLFGGSIGSALILWNACLAKRKLDRRPNRAFRRPRLA